MSHRETPHSETDHPHKKGGKLYWCDREACASCVQSRRHALETLIEAGRGEAIPGSDAMVRWADDRPEIRTYLLDAKKAQTCRLGRLFRANVEIPPAKPRRTDRHPRSFTTLCGADRSRARPQTVFSTGPTAVTLARQHGDRPRSTTTCRAGDRVTHLMEGIVSRSTFKRSMFVTDFAAQSTQHA